MSTLPGDSAFAGAPGASHDARAASAAREAAAREKEAVARHRRAFGEAVLHAPQTRRHKLAQAADRAAHTQALKQAQRRQGQPHPADVGRQVKQHPALHGAQGGH